MIENDSRVPAGLRARLEVARLENLALMRTLDHALPMGPPIPHGEILTLGELDADCGEALWALDQPQKSLDVRAMVRDTLASLERLPAVRQHLRDLFLEYPLESEKELLRGLDPAEAYSQVPGRAAVTRPSQPAQELRVGRNAPCPCGSGRKYKKCCLLSSVAAAAANDVFHTDQAIATTAQRLRVKGVAADKVQEFMDKAARATTPEQVDFIAQGY